MIGTVVVLIVCAVFLVHACRRAWLEARWRIDELELERWLDELREAGA